MREPQEQSWESIRAGGRDRFVLRMIARAICVFVLGGALVELGLWLCLKRVFEPLPAIGTWIGGGVFVGAFLGWDEWKRNEAAYTQSKGNEAIR